MRAVDPAVPLVQAFPPSEPLISKLDVQEQGRTPEETRPRVEMQVPTGLVAQQLKLADGSQVISRHQERRVDQTPWRSRGNRGSRRPADRGASQHRVAGVEDGGLAGGDGALRIVKDHACGCGV